MHATEPAVTSPSAPYDVLRPIRCMVEVQPGVKCTGRSTTDIDWSVPSIHTFRCQKCRTMNVTRIVEADLGR